MRVLNKRWENCEKLKPFKLQWSSYNITRVEILPLHFSLLRKGFFIKKEQKSKMEKKTRAPRCFSYLSVSARARRRSLQRRGLAFTNYCVGRGLSWGRGICPVSSSQPRGIWTVYVSTPREICLKKMLMSRVAGGWGRHIKIKICIKK